MKITVFAIIKLIKDTFKEKYLHFAKVIDGPIFNNIKYIFELIVKCRNSFLTQHKINKCNNQKKDKEKDTYTLTKCTTCIQHSPFKQYHKVILMLKKSKFKFLLYKT